MRITVAIVALAAASLMVVGAAQSRVEAKNNCQGARVTGEISGNVRICYLRTDSFNGDQYEITVTQVDGAGRASVGIREEGNDGYGFRNPIFSTFDVQGCATDVLSFEMGFQPGTKLAGVVFAHVPTEIGDTYIEFGTGEIGGVGKSRATRC